MVDLEALGVRTYISEPDRGRRNWKKAPTGRDAVSAIAAAFGALAGNACCASAVNVWNVP